MIDLHTHLLPNIDDGSQSVEQSIAVLDEFARLGVTDVVLTPHVRAGELVIDPDDPFERRQVALELLQREAPPVPKLHLGFEIMLDQPLPAEIMSDRRFSLAGSRYFLIEFFMSVAADSVSTALEQFVESDAVPLIAHPERYGMCSAKAICSWRDVGAKLLLDATTLTQSSSRGAKARQVIAAGCADAVASDNHGDPRSLKAAIDFMGEQGFAREAEMLAVENPRAIIEDCELDAVPPVDLQKGAWDKLKRIIRI